MASIQHERSREMDQHPQTGAYSPVTTSEDSASYSPSRNSSSSLSKTGIASHKGSSLSTGSDHGKDHTLGAGEDPEVYLMAARRDSGYQQIGESAAKFHVTVHHGNAGYASTGFNILKNVVNAGFLSLPVALVHASLIPAMVILVISCVFNTYTFILMARSCSEERVFSYRELWQVAFGSRFHGPQFIDFLMFLFTLGGAVVIVILVGDFGVFLQNFCPSGSLCVSPVFQKIIVTVVVFLPLSLLRDLHHLRFSSAFGLVCILYTAIYISANTQVDFGEPEMRPELLTFKVELTQAIALFNTAFACHYNAPRFFEEFKGQDVRKFSILSIVAYTIIAIFYAWVSIVPYYRFGGNTEGNVLNNYPDESDGTFDGDGVIAARLGMFLSVTVTFPILMSGLRFAVLRMIWPNEDPNSLSDFKIPLPCLPPPRLGTMIDTSEYPEEPGAAKPENSQSNGASKSGGDAFQSSNPQSVYVSSEGNVFASQKSEVFATPKADVFSLPKDPDAGFQNGSGTGSKGGPTAVPELTDVQSDVDSYSHRRVRVLSIPRYWPIVIFFTAVTCILGIVFTDISDVNTVRGSILGMFIMYMLPVGIYMKLGYLKSRHRSGFDVFMCVVTFVFGLITGVLGLLSLFGAI